MTFQTLGLIEPILGALADLGYEAPSPIQEQAIPPALAGRDVLGIAQTGTGKTCAFATPILQRLSATHTRGLRPIRALILTPTRELALQIQESIQAYGKNLRLRSAVIFGGVGQAPQVDAVRRGVDILVATPGRLIDLYQQKLLDFGKLEIFVLDEADRMLDMGFIHDVKKILQWLPKRKQTLFFSATMPPEVTELVNQLLHDPARVTVTPVSSPVEVIDQKLYRVDRGNKTKLLLSLLVSSQVKNALIFTRTKHGANKVAGELQKGGVPAAAIHGNKSQTARQQALADFKAGRIKALVATDIAARGLDIEELSHVFNYNLPDVPETYVHRIGRTGRAGHGGTAISFCDINEMDELKSIEKLLGKPIPEVQEHPWPMEVFTPLPRDKKGRIVNPEDAEARSAARARKAERRKSERPAKVERPAEPVAVAPAAPEQEAPKKKRRGRGRRASATLEEALTATAPRTAAPEPVSHAFHRDPLAGDVIMDATARLLAPRSVSRSQGKEEPAPRNRRSQKARKPQKEQAVQPVQESVKQPQKSRRQKNTPPPVSALEVLSGGPKKRRSRGGDRRRSSGPELAPRSGAVKDSTEQPSLMKPYYLSDD